MPLPNDDPALTAELDRRLFGNIDQAITGYGNCYYPGYCGRTPDTSPTAIQSRRAKAWVSLIEYAQEARDKEAGAE